MSKVTKEMVCRQADLQDLYDARPFTRMEIRMYSVCLWSKYQTDAYEGWKTGCDHDWIGSDDVGEHPLSESGMIFCPHCGNTLIEKTEEVADETKH